MNLLLAEREESRGGGPPPAVQDVLGADARASLIALQRAQVLGSASAADMNPAERAAAEARFEGLRRRQLQTTGKAPPKAPAPPPRHHRPVLERLGAKDEAADRRLEIEIEIAGAGVNFLLN